MTRYSKVRLLAAVSCLAIAVADPTPAGAQCSTCGPAPVVAYSPVVAAPVVAAAPVVTYEPYRGWYPGKLLDTWRMRRYGYAAPTTTYAAGYAPYTVGYAPTAYTAAYAPTTYSAGYAPYTAAYAPAYTTTSYSTPYVTSYAPLGQRQVLMRPVVVESPVIATAPLVSSGCTTCSACEAAAPCSACAATAVVEQATYSAAPAPCAGCAQGSTVTYADQTAPITSNQTPQPQLTPQEAAPLRSNYPDVTPPKGAQQNDPGPAAETNPSDSSTYFEPPALFIPNDRTAEGQTVKPANRAPSVNVWNAVYRQQVDADNVSATVGRSQAEIDADGWSSVPTN